MKMTAIPAACKGMQEKSMICFFLILAFLALPAYTLAAPSAGTEIGNQASAIYTDAAGINRTTTSNVVITTVTQVASMSMTSDGSAFGTPNSTVYFPHTLTNTGNSTDTFTLTVANDTAAPADTVDYTSGSLAIYADANGDGIADDNVNLAGTTVTLLQGEVFQFMTAGTLPSTATSGDTADLLVTATSSFDSSSVSNTDRATLSSQAIITMTKSFSTASGNANGTTPYTVTIDYSNTGFATATSVALTDALPAGLTYVAGSGRWSVTGTLALSDADDNATEGTSPTIEYWYTAATDTVDAIISSVPAGQSGSLSFQVTIDSGYMPGDVFNVATLAYNDGVAVQSASSNNAPINVLQTASVNANDNGSSTDTDATLNDIVTVASAFQGASVSFDNVISNNGNGIDTFNITVGGSTYPAGTSFQLFQSDGVTPLLDTNGDSVPDTGPLAPGASYSVFVVANLPIGANGSGPYTVTKTARSAFNPAILDTVIDRLDSIIASQVDVTNNVTGTMGNGIGPEVAPVSTMNTDPGMTVVFPLYIFNETGAADNYNLSHAFTDISYDTSSWVVEFRNSTTNALITNTGNISAGGSLLVNANVIVPAGYAATDTAADPDGVNIHFTATSSGTGATDTKHDSVVVNVINELQLNADNSGQVYPGGNVVYTHTLFNTGNVTENGIDIVLSGSSAGFSATTYLDVNSDGLLDPGDTVLEGVDAIASLAAGSSVTMFVVIQANAGTSVGSVDATILTATADSAASAFNTDTTTVVPDDLVLSKVQAVDANCDGVPDTAYAATAVSAAPGQCIMYRVTATNSGAADVTSVVINDTTPAFTSVDTVPTATVGTVSGAITVGATGTITVTVGTLTPAASSILTFGVLIDPVPPSSP